MKVKVKCEEFNFNISVGSGNKDLVWLALVAANMYGKLKQPRGNYLPIFLRTKDYDDLHPRSRIGEIIKMIEDYGTKSSDIEFIVSIKKDNTPLTKAQEDWSEKSFGAKRNIMKIDLRVTPTEKYQKKNLMYTARVEYNIFPEIAPEFRGRVPDTIQKIQLERTMEGNLEVYVKELYLPFGSIDIKFLISDATGERNLADEYADHSYDITPNRPMSLLEFNKIEAKLAEAKSHEIEETEKKSQKEMASKREEEIKAEEEEFVCPFNINNLWNFIEASWISEDDQIERIRNTIGDNLQQLYDIFFSYYRFYNQQRIKADEYQIPWQDVMHFLKFYEVFDEGKIFEFLEYYEHYNQKVVNVSGSLQLETGVTFPEFCSVLLKAAHYIKTMNMMSKGEDLDVCVKNQVENIIKKHAATDQYTDFQRHMRFCEPLIELFREHSDFLMKLFVYKMEDSGQIAIRHFHMLRNEIKSIITEIGITSGNVDEVVETCFNEILPPEKYQGFEGVFYHEYLQIMLWLALVLIQRSDEDDQGADEGAPITDDVLLDKTRFFIDALQDKFKTVLSDG